MKKSLFVLAVLMLAAGSLLAQSDNFPLVKFSFKVKIDNVEFLFQEVSGLESETQVVEYRGGNSKVYSTVKMPGIQKFSNVTLKKGIMKVTRKSSELMDQLNRQTNKRFDVTVELMDEQNKPAMTWTLKKGFIVKLKAADLRSANDELAIETMEIAHEGLVIKK